MSKILFWDNGIRNAIIDDLNPLSSRNDQGPLFENFMISERLKMNAYFRPTVKSYFWRNYNKSEVDYIETDKTHISAYEIKWNTKKKFNVSRAFRHLYPEADMAIIQPNNIVDFTFGNTQ